MSVVSALDVETYRKHPGFLRDDIAAAMIADLKRLPRPHFSPAVAIEVGAIAEFGLVALRDIEAGEVVVVERGPRVDGTFVNMIEGYTGYECNTCVGRNEYILHQPMHGEAPGGYINHSCDPNVGMLEDGVWVAIAPIAKGAEAVCDYGTFETMRDWTMACNCGSEVCRKVITWRDWAIPDLRKRLGRWFAPYLRRRLERMEEAMVRRQQGAVDEMLEKWSRLRFGR